MRKEPLVLCLTNTVAANFTANCLLAIGAKPAMIEEPSEAAELAAVADSVLVNVGTVQSRQAEVMRAAIKVSREKKVPWVLDPVACHLLAYRRRLVEEFLGSVPTLIRGNCAEIAFLREKYATQLGTVPILATGEVDEIWHGAERRETIAGGVARLQDVTATGCAQGGICAALLGWGQTPEEVCVTAARLMKKAGELAFSRTRAPGSFQMALLDALFELSPIRRGV